MCPGMVLVQRVTGRTRNTARGWYETRRTASVETAVPQGSVGKGDGILMMGQIGKAKRVFDRTWGRQSLLSIF